MIAVDEAHAVDHWGDFKESYRELHRLRIRASTRGRIPWFATSATLDPETLKSAKEHLGFRDDVRVKRTSIDRPEIFFNSQPMRHPGNTFIDLKFLVQPGEDGNITKTLVYVDDIARGAQILQRLREWSGIPRNQAYNVFVGYHGQMAEADRKRICAEFRKPDSVHRIIVVTDAMGLEIDSPDIEQVVNWGLASSLCNIMQRAGRAARGKDLQGEFIWFVPPWCFQET